MGSKGSTIPLAALPLPASLHARRCYSGKGCTKEHKQSTKSGKNKHVITSRQALWGIHHAAPQSQLTDQTDNIQHTALFGNTNNPRPYKTVCIMRGTHRNTHIYTQSSNRISRFGRVRGCGMRPSLSILHVLMATIPIGWSLTGSLIGIPIGFCP